MAQLIIPETAPARLAGPGEPNQPNTSRKDSRDRAGLEAPMLRTAVVRGVSVRPGLMQRNRGAIARQARAPAPALLSSARYQHVAPNT